MLRVSQKDPTSDKTNALGFLIKEVDRPGGETLADITHATLNGDDLTDIEVVNLVNELDLPSIPAGYPPAPGSEAVARQPSPPADLSVFRPGMNFEEVQEKLGMLGIKPRRFRARPATKPAERARKTSAAATPRSSTALAWAWIPAAPPS